MNVQTAWSTRIATILCHVALVALALATCHMHVTFAESLVTPAAVQAESYCCDQRASNAIDHDLGTAWNSGHEPPATIILDMGEVRALSRIELLTAQLPDGITEHQISVSDDLVSWTNALQLEKLHDRQSVAFDPD